MENFPYLTQAISRVISRLRKQSGLSQQKLAELSSVDRIYLLQLEQGKFRPTLNSIFYLAKGLGLSPSQLVALIEAECQQLESENKTTGDSG